MFHRRLISCAALRAEIRLAALVVLVLGLQSGGGAARSPSHPNPMAEPMIFAIVRSVDPACEPTCPEWIQAEGRIVPQTVAAFKRILTKAGDRNLPLLIASPGGSVDHAIELGRIIRKRGMNVEVAHTRYLDCTPRDKSCAPDRNGHFYRGYALTIGAFCWSACPLVLAGGIRRIAANTTHTGVYQVTTVRERYQLQYRVKYRLVGGRKRVLDRKVVSRKRVSVTTTTRLSKATRRMLIAYFNEMTIKRAMLDLMLSTPPESIRRLTYAEMADLGLVSEPALLEVLVRPQLCLGEKPAENCILRGTPKPVAAGSRFPVPSVPGPAVNAPAARR